MRGARRHGWGKHHRGKGNHGGKGNAGRGKRAAHKKPSYRLQPLGKYGFKNPNKTPAQVTISFRDIARKLPNWKTQKLVEEKNGMLFIDLTKLGYTKLLGTGKLTTKMHLRIANASQKAIEKIKTMGGQAS